MTYFADLSRYTYGATEVSEPFAYNIGWISADANFPTTSEVDPVFLDRLWLYCTVSVGQTRGIHECELCRDRIANIGVRGGERLLLGSAEIRVPSMDARYFAAPNLIFHYVGAHRYSPPSEFVRAVMTAPCPPEREYFEWLVALGMNCSKTLAPEPLGKSFRFVKTADGVVKVED